MINLSYRYDQTSVRLEVIGVPDYSSGQNENVIGIISSWKLDIVGFPQLEGKRQHLESLLEAVMPYARNCISGIAKQRGTEQNSVQIIPDGNNHILILRSSQDGVKPLELNLDSAELADLVRCLDELRNDYRIAVKWKIPEPQPLSKRDIANKTPLLKRVLPSLLGISSTGLIAFTLFLVPPPEPSLTSIENLEQESRGK